MDIGTSLLAQVDLGRDVASFRLARPQGFEYAPGQYCIVRLGDGLVRAFTLSSSPGEPDLSFTTKNSGSDFKRRLFGLKPGDALSLRGPLGEFTLRDGVSKYIFLAGGIGVTPFRSMLSHAAGASLPIDAVLVWGVNAIEDAFFMDDFAGLPANLRVEYVPAKPPAGWGTESGFIGSGHISRLAPDFAERMTYVCGPPKMVEAMGKVLGELNVPQQRIVVERFDGY